MSPHVIIINRLFEWKCRKWDVTIDEILEVFLVNFSDTQEKFLDCIIKALVNSENSFTLNRELVECVVEKAEI